MRHEKRSAGGGASGTGSSSTVAKPAKNAPLAIAMSAMTTKVKGLPFTLRMASQTVKDLARDPAEPDL